ncbi:hypothetical protein T440DRAFT_278545 [Plenodomus tracheiphilus IPT5]|uniref:Uncharacterized protein n=1 Tax=Plenodomus tracheiphilus IPT5 TaxID=1408161 RepID=A0A6A7ASV4_9PLEO|nr:hypothetical protein T440DRAFT_278545 [Plenodomus tracheiphilus IPT5]
MCFPPLDARFPRCHDSMHFLPPLLTLHVMMLLLCLCALLKHAVTVLTFLTLCLLHPLLQDTVQTAHIPAQSHSYSACTFDPTRRFQGPVHRTAHGGRQRRGCTRSMFRRNGSVWRRRKRRRRLGGGGRSLTDLHARYRVCIVWKDRFCIGEVWRSEYCCSSGCSTGEARG